MSKIRVSWTECVLVGVGLFGMVGTGVVLPILVALVYLIRSELVSPTEFNPTVVAFSATAASLSGVIAWRWIVATKDSSPIRGAWAGSVAGVVSHPLCWFLLLLFQTLREPTLRSQPPEDMAFGVVFMTMMMTISSLGLVGWISAPLGAALGYVAKRVMRDFRPAPSNPQANRDGSPDLC